MNVIEWFFGYETIEFYGMPCCVLGFCIICLLCICLLGIVIGVVYSCTARIISKLLEKKKAKMTKESRTNDTIKQDVIVSKAVKEFAEKLKEKAYANNYCQEVILKSEIDELLKEYEK